MMKKSTGYNIGLPAMAGIVVNSAFVHLKIFRAWGQVSVSKPPLRQAKNRCRQCYTTAQPDSL